MNKVDRMKILVRHVVRTGLAKSQNDFGKLLGYGNESYFSQIVNEKREMPKDFIKKLSALVPDLNADWLLYGEGEMLRTSAHSFSVSSACCGPAVSVAGNISGSGNSVHGVVGESVSSHELLRHLEKAHDLAKHAQGLVGTQQALIEHANEIARRANENVAQLIKVVERLTGEKVGGKEES